MYSGPAGWQRDSQRPRHGAIAGGMSMHAVQVRVYRNRPTRNVCRYPTS
jgi:hypothetical protein